MRGHATLRQIGLRFGNLRSAAVRGAAKVSWMLSPQVFGKPSYARSGDRSRDVDMRRLFILVFVAASVTACATGLSQRGADLVETHEAMGRWINQASTAIWDLRSEARSPTEGLDPSLMGEAGWIKLRQASRSLEIHARRMAQARSVQVDARGEQPPGFPSPAQIQARIDADPMWFRRLSLQMADHARELNAAARARNPQRANDLIESMNESCQTCHTRYWAPAAP